jgi:hypothetical protein
MNFDLSSVFVPMGKSCKMYFDGRKKIVFGWTGKKNKKHFENSSQLTIFDLAHNCAKQCSLFDHWKTNSPDYMNTLSRPHS